MLYENLSGVVAVLKTQHDPTEFTLKKLTWELPLGTIRGQLEEPGPRFTDPYVKEEREAIQALSKEKG